MYMLDRPQQMRRNRLRTANRQMETIVRVLRRIRSVIAVLTVHTRLCIGTVQTRSGRPKMLAELMENRSVPEEKIRSV
jgi:hypothetical protein